MILAFDTYYFNDKAKTVCIEFEDWAEKDNFQLYTETLEHIEEYIPGEFYRRELPCILSLLNKINHDNIDVIVVDGYVFLDDDGKPGLGGHLYSALQNKIPVIGVAKSNFQTIEKLKMPLLRGDSKNPLFITSIGIGIEEATAQIRQMDGQFRIPTLLKILDKATKEK
jgi:deoxyribonuclease V